MKRETIVPSVPDIRQDNTLEVLRAIKSTLDVREGSIGDPLDQNVTLRDLADLNLVLASSNATTARQGGGSLPVVPVLPPAIGGYNPATDFTVPPAPTNLRARGGFTNVYLEWDGAPYRNHGYTEIWRASADNLGQAVMVGTTAASLYADPAQPDTTYYYWIRFVSLAAVAGPYNQTSGTQATTAIDVSSAITAISRTITDLQLFRDLGSRIDAIETNAYIQNLTSGRFKSQLDQLSSGIDSANSQITSLRSVSSSQAVMLTELSTTSGAKTRTFFQAAAPVSSLEYTLAKGDVWYDTDDNNKSYRWSGSAWVAFANSTRVFYQSSAPQSSAASPLFVGDMWYDSDDNNKPHRWNGTAWEQLRDGFINARVTTLEQTKIGYATLNATGLVFDNNGAITDKASTDAWNAANPNNQATWNVGLPFATAVKQVGVTEGGETLTLEQRFTAQRQVNGNLYGQYTIKIDDKGHVSGFGLASTNGTAGPLSAFIVRADRFAIVGANDTTDPLGTITPTKLPFIVTNTPTVVNGKTYPAGTWIDTAFVANATITNAQIADLTADKITAGSLSAALGMSTGKIWGGVAISNNKDNGTFGQLIYPFGSTNFGTGFFLGLDSSVYKFYVGSPTQNMKWDGSSLSVTGNLNAVSGTFRNITVYDSQDRVILSSGGVNTSLLGLGALATADNVAYSSITGTKPPSDATRNQVSSGALSSRPGGVDGDFYYATDNYTLYQKVSGSWVISGTVGAPAGTLINGVAVATITGAVTNFNNSNDRNATAVTTPTIATNGTALDHTLQTNGSADISFEWAWSGNEGDIDGFQVYVYQSSSAAAYSFGGAPADEMVYEVPAAKRAFILYGVVPDRYYTFGVRAYRIVDKDVNAAGVITSAIAKSFVSGENPYQPSAQVAFAGNVTGTVNSIAVADLNVWSKISGAGKPADNATKNTVYRQANAPSSGMSVNDIWFDTDDNATYSYNGSTWVKVGDVTSENQAFSIRNQGALATANSVFVGSTVKFADGTTLNTGDFVNRLAKIGTGNISTFIDGAAITDAYIGNLNASKITAGTIAADRLDATVITGKVANLQGAQIGNLQVNTLQIANNAVTVPAVATSSTLVSVTRWPVGTVLSNWQTVVSVTANFGDDAVSSVLVCGNVNILSQSGVRFTASYMRLRNITNGSATVDVGVAHGDSTVLSNFGLLSANPGNNTFVLEISQEDTGGSTWLAASRSISVIGAKK